MKELYDVLSVILLMFMKFGQDYRIIIYKAIGVRIVIGLSL